MNVALMLKISSIVSVEEHHAYICAKFTQILLLFTNNIYEVFISFCEHDK